MEIKISLDEYADVAFIKKLLSQLKGVTNVEISSNEKQYSWEEIENSDAFLKVMEQSRDQIKDGHFEEYSEDFLDSIFRRK